MCLSWSGKPLTSAQLKEQNSAEQTNVGLISALAFTVTSVPIHGDSWPAFLPEDDNFLVGMHHLLWMLPSEMFIVATFLSILSLICAATIAEEEVAAYFKTLGILAHLPFFLFIFAGFLRVVAVVFNTYYSVSLWAFYVVLSFSTLTLVTMGTFGAWLVQAEWDAKRSGLVLAQQRKHPGETEALCT